MPTQRSLPATRAGLLASITLLAACTATPTIDERDSFTQGNTYSRSFPGSSQAACEAGRRALLGQGYIIDKAEPNRVSGHKNYQDKENNNQHVQIVFNVDCAPSGDGNALVYTSALRDLYAMKKSSNSASVGLSVLGSVSMPVGSSYDSLVKTSSETISRGAFYEGFFEQVKQNLASAQAAIESGTTPAQNPQPAAPAATTQEPGGASAQPEQPEVPSGQAAPSTQSTQPTQPQQPTEPPQSTEPAAAPPTDASPPNLEQSGQPGSSSPSAQPSSPDSPAAPAEGGGNATPAPTDTPGATP